MLSGEMRRCKYCQVKRPVELFPFVTTSSSFLPDGSKKKFRSTRCCGCGSSCRSVRKGDGGGTYSLGSPIDLWTKGAPLSEIQAESNKRTDRIRAKRGLPPFSFVEHVSHDTGHDEAILPDGEREAALERVFTKAEERLAAAARRGAPARKPQERRVASAEDMAESRRRRVARLQARAEAMTPTQLLEQAATRQIRAVMAPSGRVARHNAAYAEKRPVSVPRAPAKRKDWTLTLEQRFALLRQQRGLCHVTGLPFELAGRNFWQSRHPLAPSLDRIDSSLGYTYENACLVMLLWNYAKNSCDEQVAKEAFLAIAEAIRSGPKTAALSG